jgi:uncharacterized protein (DUF362 family)/Pyruvate/2-oxoacid:ferredoxin oxidoreductase delta subunit
MAKVSVLKCESYDVDLIYTVIKESLKNIDFQLPQNKKVLLKPNVLGQKEPQTAVCTHPAILDALCVLLKENNNEIWIGDSSGIAAYGGTSRAFEIAGIAAVAKKHNTRLISFEGSKRKEIHDKDAKVLKRFIIAKEPFEADLVINLPKLKTHVLMKYTGAVKNMFGCIPGGGKSEKHALAPNEDDFGNLLLDIYKHVIPKLNIMDAIIGLEGDGPGSAGNPKKVGLIIASKDAVALDIVASGIIGFQPLEIKTTKYAIERGLGPGIKTVEVLGEKGMKLNFRKPTRKSRLATNLPKPLVKFMWKLLSFKPYLKKKNCKKCNICATVCPVKAITLNPYPAFNRKKCVLCYCCHEHCPHNAIKISKSAVIKAYEAMNSKFKKKVKRGTFSTN